MSVLRELQRETKPHTIALPDRVEIRSRPSASLGNAASNEPFRRILAACAGGGLYQIILDEGSITSDLVQLVRRAAASARISCLCDRLCPIPKERGRIAWYRPSEQALHALSPRETDILTLIAGDCPNKEIARSLYIGPETVKSHSRAVSPSSVWRSARKRYHARRPWPCHDQ